MQFTRSMMNCDPNGEILQYAVSCLQAGKIIAYPCEGVWGLGCDYHNSQAVAALIQLKKRDPAAGLILISGQWEHFAVLFPYLDVAAQRTICKQYSHARSWMIPDPQQVIPQWIRGAHEGVVIRLSHHLPIAALTYAWGKPLVSTSANPHGASPARDAAGVQGYFGAAVSCIINGSLGNDVAPSQIFDWISREQIR